MREAALVRASRMVARRAAEHVNGLCNLVTRSPRSPSADAAGLEPVIIVVDADAAMREALEGLFRSVGLRVQTYGSAQAFMDVDLPATPCCLVLDVRMPGMSGLDLQTELANEDIRVPIIFLTGFGDVPMAVRAIRAGAVNFMTKPVRDQDLLDAVTSAIELARRNWHLEARRTDVRAKFKSLTPREQEIMGHVASGLLNKQIAFELGLSEVTVKIHRSNLTRKMGAHSLPELLRMADDLGLMPG